MTIPAPVPTPKQQILSGLVNPPAPAKPPESLDVIDKDLVDPQPFEIPSFLDCSAFVDLVAIESTSTASDLRSRFENIATQAATKHANALASFEDAVGDDLNELDELTRDKLRKQGKERADKAAKEFVSNALASDENYLNGLEAKIERREKQVKGLLKMCPSEIAYIHALSTANDENMTLRAKWQSAITGAGYSLLKQLAYRAIITRDKVLGSVVAEACAGMRVQGKQKPPISGQTLARQIIGNDYSRLILLGKELADLRANLAEQKKSLAGGKQTGYSAIVAALRKIDIAKTRAALGVKVGD
jgi:hypothetical protein